MVAYDDIHRLHNYSLFRLIVAYHCILWLCNRLSFRLVVAYHCILWLYNYQFLTQRLHIIVLHGYFNPYCSRISCIVSYVVSFGPLMLCLLFISRVYPDTDYSLKENSVSKKKVENWRFRRAAAERAECHTDRSKYWSKDTTDSLHYACKKLYAERMYTCIEQTKRRRDGVRNKERKKGKRGFANGGKEFQGSGPDEGAKRGNR